MLAPSLLVRSINAEFGAPTLKGVMSYKCTSGAGKQTRGQRQRRAKSNTQARRTLAGAEQGGGTKSNNGIACDVAGKTAAGKIQARTVKFMGR